MSKYKLKPEYEFFKEIYLGIEKDFENSRKNINHYDNGVAYGYVGCYNRKTGFYDDLWLNDDMFEKGGSNYLYYPKDPALKALVCGVEGLFEEFQKECKDQWGDGTEVITIDYPITQHDRDDEDTTIFVFNRNEIDRVISEE